MTDRNVAPSGTPGSRFFSRHLPGFARRTTAPALLLLLLAACSSSDDSNANVGTGGTGGDGGSGGGGAGTGGAPDDVCPTEDSVFDVGDETGHTDPYGARAAGEARAGRLTEASMIVQPAHGRQQIRVGDYVLANDTVAVVIEDIGLSDGYSRFGGEILAIDKVGEDGRPLGVSNYVETLIAIANEVVEPTSVTVINDGSDGSAAIIRATGRLSRVAILSGALGRLFGTTGFGHTVALDYVLEPGSAKLKVRLGLINPSEDALEVASGQSMHGFFQTNHNQLVTLGNGFETPDEPVDWVGFVSGPWNFAYRLAGGAPIAHFMDTSGFHYYKGEGYTVEGCSTLWRDHIEIIAGGPHFDGLIAAVRAVDGETASATVTGTVRTADGDPVAGAYIHAEGDDGTYLSRTQTDELGKYTVNVIGDDGGWGLVVGQQELPTKLAVPAGSESVVDIDLPANGAIHVTTTEKGTDTELPVRIQVVPADSFEGWAGKYGIANEKRGRLHQEFAMNGDATLLVPPGEHRVIVSRGYEWELHDETVDVAAGETIEVAAELEHSVNSDGIFCADFHIHSQHSADSSDPIPLKVKSAIADGLDIPVSSEHDWVVDFQPVIESLGLEEWAFGMPSEELTTFSWGHFGVIPITPNPDAVNNGAVDWTDKTPAELFELVQGLPEDPVLVVNHPYGDGFGTYFSVAGLDRETGTGTDTELWSDNFDAIEVFNGSGLDSNREGSVADWFALLNAGYTFWAVGSSDSHGLRSSPVGYPRTCMPFGHNDLSRLTADGVAQVLGTGSSTISGGLLMTVTGPSGEEPGDILAGESSKEFLIEVRAPSWVEADTLEVIVNGVSQPETALLPFGDDTGNTYVNRVTVDFDQTKDRSWVVFHAKGSGDLMPVHSKSVFAVSNPVFYEP